LATDWLRDVLELIAKRLDSLENKRYFPSPDLDHISRINADRDVSSATLAESQSSGISTKISTAISTAVIRAISTVISTAIRTSISAAINTVMSTVISTASNMSTTPVATLPMPVAPIFNPGLVSFLKCAPSSAKEKGLVESVDKIVKCRLKRPKEKNKIGNSEEIDSKSESAAIKHPSKNRHKKWLYPENYDSTTPLPLFLANVESCANYNDWTNIDKLAHVRLRLVGTAAHALSGGNSTITTYSDLVEKLKKRFGTMDQSARYRSQLKGRRRQKK